jgi:hypothetical protein
MHLKVDVRLQQLECVITDDEVTGDEPYLWVFFLTFDGGTVRQAPGGALRLVGNVVVQSGPGGHENLGVTDVTALQKIDIPAPIGAYSTTLRPIRLDLAGQTIFLPGRVVAVAMLLEEDEAPPSTVISRAHASIRELVETSVNDFVNTLNLAQLATEVQNRMTAQGGSLQSNAEAVLNARIDALVEALKAQAPSVVETEFLLWHTPGAFWELFGFADPDDRIGSKTLRFSERRLVSDPGEMHHTFSDPLQRVEDGVIKALYDLSGRVDAVVVTGSDDVEQTGDTRTRSVRESGVHVFDEPRLCVEPGERAEWTLYAQEEEESYLFRYPFLEPVWTIEGKELTGSSGTANAIATCAVPFFDPTKPGGPGHTSSSRVVTIRYETFKVGQLHGLRLRNLPSDGRYGVTLDVGVRPGGGDLVAVATFLVSFDGLALESPFYDRFRECMKKFERVGEAYAKSKRPSLKDLWGPTARRRRFEEQMALGRELVEAGELTDEQLRRAEGALRAKLRVGR